VPIAPCTSSRGRRGEATARGIQCVYLDNRQGGFRGQVNRSLGPLPSVGVPRDDNPEVTSHKSQGCHLERSKRSRSGAGSRELGAGSCHSERSEESQGSICIRPLRSPRAASSEFGIRGSYPQPDRTSLARWGCLCRAVHFHSDQSCQPQSTCRRCCPGSRRRLRSQGPSSISTVVSVRSVAVGSSLQGVPS